MQPLHTYSARVQSCLQAAAGAGAMVLGSSQPPRYLQPCPSVAVGQSPFEEGCHVFNGNVNGIVLLELHFALLYGQAIDLDARSNRNLVCPQP